MENSQEFEASQPSEQVVQPQQFRYASFQHRLGGIALDTALAIVALFIGWFIWSLIVWQNGQTPAKQILKLRVLHESTGKRATWGHMAVREFLVPLTVAIACGVSAGVLGIAWITLEIVFYFVKGQRTLRDYWVRTVVVNEA